MPTINDLTLPLNERGHQAWTITYDPTEGYVFPKGVPLNPGKDVPVLRITIFDQSLRVWCYMYRHALRKEDTPFQGFSPTHPLVSMTFVETFHASEHTRVEEVLQTIDTCGASWLETGALGTGAACESCMFQLKCLAKTYRVRPNP